MRGHCGGATFHSDCFYYRSKTSDRPSLNGQSMDLSPGAPKTSLIHVVIKEWQWSYNCTPIFSETCVLCVANVREHESRAFHHVWGGGGGATRVAAGTWILINGKIFGNTILLMMLLLLNGEPPNKKNLHFFFNQDISSSAVHCARASSSFLVVLRYGSSSQELPISCNGKIVAARRFHSALMYY